MTSSRRCIIKFLTIIRLLLITNAMKGTIPVEGLKKPVAKTIKTKFGDIYDCVDFYEQPAFKHPLLRNHSFNPKMRPSSRPKWMEPNTLKMDVKEASFVQFKNGGCPLNTVPIRRTGLEDLSRIELLSKSLASNAATLQPGTHRAISQTRTSPSIKPYYGVGGLFSVWNPPVKEDQYSSAQFIIQDGLDSIQVGWTVNPTLYKNNRTHMFIHTTTAGGLHCFNTYCPGFVIVRSDMPPDMQFDAISTRGGPVYAYRFFVYQDQVNGNWWLEFGHDHIPIGFWPNKIFSGLAQSGSYAACGGEAYNPSDKPGVGPPMGTGDFVKGPGLPNWDAYCANFIIVNENHEIVDARHTEVFCDSRRYQVRDVGFTYKKSGHVLFYGGPGGN